MSLLWDSVSAHIVAFFETSVLKEVRILLYLHDIIAVLIIYLINFRNLFHGYLFTLFVLRLFLTLLYKWIEKLEKLKTFLKTCFLHNRIFISSLVIFYGIRKTPTRKIPIQKVPTNQTPPRRIPSPKIPTQKIPT